MFDDDNTLRRDEVRFVQEFEGPDVVVFVVVGRIEKDEVGHEFAGFQTFEAAHSVGLDDFGAGQSVERFEILFDEFYGAGVGFDENRVTRAAADGFDADGSRAREEVDEE